MRYAVYRYYTTFETIEVEATTASEALGKANTRKEVSAEQIMANLERWELADEAHPEPEE